jgi:hypothetical protein
MLSPCLNKILMGEPKLSKFNKKAPIIQNSENIGLKLQLLNL